MKFRLCVLAYRCLQGTAPPYLASGLHRTTENSARRSLRSADTTSLLVPSTRRATLWGPCVLRGCAEGVELIVTRLAWYHVISEIPPGLKSGAVPEVILLNSSLAL